MRGTTLVAAGVGETVEAGCADSPPNALADKVLVPNESALGASIGARLIEGDFAQLEARGLLGARRRCGEGAHCRAKPERPFVCPIRGCSSCQRSPSPWHTMAVDAHVAVTRLIQKRVRILHHGLHVHAAVAHLVGHVVRHVHACNQSGYCHALFLAQPPDFAASTSTLPLELCCFHLNFAAFHLNETRGPLNLAGALRH